MPERSSFSASRTRSLSAAEAVQEFVGALFEWPLHFSNESNIDCRIAQVGDEMIARTDNETSLHICEAMAVVDKGGA